MLSGRHFMDGIDLYLTYGIFIESGIDDFLKFPARKEGITHDWKDSDGVDTDLSQNFFAPRPIALRCALIAADENDFWKKYNDFIFRLMQPGLRRLEFTQFTGRSFYVSYDATSAFDRFTRLVQANKIACKFTLNLTEQKPKLDSANVYLIDEAGRFIIT